MLTLQRFKTMRLIVRVLVVVFGLSVVFHALDVYGHGTADGQRTLVNTDTDSDHDEIRKPETCPACGEWERTRVETKVTTITTTVTKHYHLSNGDWHLQSQNVERNSSSSRSSYLTACEYTYSDGTQCAG